MSATTWLVDYLAGCPTSGRLLIPAAKARGFTLAELERAVTELGITLEAVGGEVVWFLPEVFRRGER